MPTNLTGSTIASTYPQLLHIDGGPTAVPATVHSGTGVATAFQLGTLSGRIANVEFTGSTVQAVAGSLTLGASIAFANASNARTALGLGTIATQNANNVAITGGAISGVSFSGVFTGITSITSDSFNTSPVAANVTLSGTTLAAGGTDTNVDINITPKGTGEVNVTNIDILSGKVPFNTVTNRAYASFFDAGTTDQTGSTTDRTAVKWATAAVAGAGITVASDSRITLAAAGTYRINVSLQFFNSDNTVRTVDLWFAKNGTNIPDTGARITVPANNAGGTNLVAYEVFVTVAANDYVEMFWYPSNVSAKLHYIAAVASNPGVTPAIPAVPPAIVVVERIA